MGVGTFICSCCMYTCTYLPLVIYCINLQLVLERNFSFKRLTVKGLSSYFLTVIVFYADSTTSHPYTPARLSVSYLVHC